MNTKTAERTEQVAGLAQSAGDVAVRREKSPAEVLREQMEKQKPEFDLVLPPGVTVDRFVRTIMTAVQADPALMDADRKSLLQSAMQAAQDGLLPDKREGAFVIYNTKVKQDGKEIWINKVQWMPMIRGVIKKAREGGEIATLSARVVYANDEFEYVLGDDERIVHKPTMEARGKIVACYAIAQMKDGEREREVMTADDVAAVRSASKSKSGPWAGPFEAEMWRKSVLRRLIKRLPMTPILEQIINRDESHYDFKDGNGTRWQPRQQLDAPAAPTRAQFQQPDGQQQIADAAEDAEIIEDDPHACVNEESPQEPAGEQEEAPPSDANDLDDDAMEIAVAFTREALGALSEFKTANAINNWHDTTFIPKATELRLSEAQISIVDGKRKERLAALKK
jgi:recombination protein RecT